MLPDEYLALWQRAVSVLDRNRRPETVLEKAARLNCVHAWYLDWSGRCEGCRLTPLSKDLPDHVARGAESD